MAAWRYSASSYTPRDRSHSRDGGSSTTSSRYGSSSLSTPSYSSTDRPSRWSSSQTTSNPPAASRSNSIEEHGPVWAKSSVHTSPSSLVQRLKERYKVPDTPAPSPSKRPETKDLTLPLSRPYGRSTTSPYNSLDKSVEKAKEAPNDQPAKRETYPYNRADTDRGSSIFRSTIRKRSPEPEKTYEYRTRKPEYTPIESKPKIYTSSSLGSSPATSRYLSKKLDGSISSPGSTPSTPTTPSTERNYVLEKFERAQNKEIEETITMVTRGTSPTQPSTSSYLRNRKATADAAKNIEKTVPRPKTRPIMIDKDSQADDSSQSSSSSSIKPKQRSSYIGISATYTPAMSRYSAQTSSYAPTPTRPPVTSSRFGSDYRRSTSREPSPITHRETFAPRSSILKTESSKSTSSFAPTSTHPPITTSRFGGTSEYRRSASREASPILHMRESILSKPPAEKTNPSKVITALKTIESPQISTPTKVTSYTPVKEPVVRLNSTAPKSTPPSSPAPDSSSKSLKSPSPASGETSQASIVSKLSSPSPAKEPIVRPKSNASKSATPSSPDNSEKSIKSPSPALKTKSPSPLINATKTLKDTSEKSIKSATPLKSPSPAGSKATDRSRSKTQDSDTNISVSGFSEVSKSNSVVKSVKVTSPSPQQLESSESESESDETATTTTTDSETDDDVEDLTKSTEPSSVKRSITNFLLNNGDPTGSRSRANLFSAKSGSQAKIKFTRHESGERAWWLDSSSNVPDGIVRLQSCKTIHRMSDKNLLTPGSLQNRQFSRDKDWLKSSSEDVSEKSNATSPLPPRSPNTSSPHRNNVLPPAPGLDNTLFLDVPKLPVLRQWSDEKPWWMSDSEEGSKDNSISVERELSNNNSLNTSNTKENICNGPSQLNVSGSKSGDRLLIASKSLSKLSPERYNNVECDGEDIDVTPALRRRREQQALNTPQQLADYQLNHNEDAEENNNDPKPFLEDCKLEFSVRDLTQKLASVTNALTPKPEDKTSLLESGDMTGMIEKAKAGLIKSQAQHDGSDGLDETPVAKEVEKAEIDIYWKELVDSLDRPLTLCDIDFTDLTEEDEKDIFGQKRLNGEVPLPPPLMMMNGPIPAPPPSLGPPPPMLRNPQPPAPPPPSIVKNKKTVKLFWREVNEAMFPTLNGTVSIWQELNPVIVDTAKLEQLFESRAKDFLNKKQQEQNKVKSVIVLDNKRSNAINIGMTKLPPPRAIKAAILKMDSTVVTKEGIEKLLAMLPTEEEVGRIQDAQQISPELPLGSAEQFLLTLASISELEARLKLWAFKLEFENSEKEICEPLQDLKQGMAILRSNRTFRGILSTLLSIGNFLNGQEVKGFQIDYLSKVPEVKDTVNKHSLLHHLCVFVMEKFPDSTDLYSEIGPVTRASKTDYDELSANVKKLEDECKCSWNHLKIIAKHEGQTAMKAKMSDFLADCAERIILIGVVHRRIMSRFGRFALWLGIPINRISTTRPHDLCKVIAEFALEYRTTRERILQQVKRTNHHRDKSRSRANLVNENHINARKINSKEAKEDAKLRLLLTNDESTSEALTGPVKWRRQRKESSIAANDQNHDDTEILETLIKTANKQPSTREALKERRRSRIADRKHCKISYGLN